MSVLTPGFAERVFEFAFNAEYAHRNQAVLAASPNIPSQNEEKWLGYDVEFVIAAAGGGTHTVALQHKVSRYVDNWTRSNDHFYSAASGPYYAFRLDVDQYNMIHWLSTLGLPGAEIHYCAPLFATKASMDRHYLGNSVEGNSIWIDVQGSGALNSNETHTIVYDERGTKAFVFSEDAQKLEVVTSPQRRERSAIRREERVDFALLDAKLRGALRHYWEEMIPQERVQRRLADDFRFPLAPPSDALSDGTAKSVGDLLAAYAGLDVLVETALPVEIEGDKA